MGASLHVCFLTLSFGENSEGGVMHHVVNLTKALQSQNVTTSVICPAYGEPWRYVHDGRMDVIGIREAGIDWGLSPAMLGFGWRCRRALLDLHHEKPIDVIHLHDRAPFLGAHRAAQELDIAVVYTAHSVLNVNGQGYRPLPLLLSRLLEQWIARSSTPTIAVSQWTRDQMIALGAARECVAVIYNGVDAEAFPYRGLEGRDPCQVLFVGRLDADKGFDVLLRAIQQIAVTRKVHLTAVGAGHLEARYRELARQLGIADHVKFMGRLIGEDLVGAFQRAAVCVLPSRAEPFGMVMLEAMSCGAPFVASAAGGIAEIAEHDRTALLVPPEDPAALALAITRVLDDRARARGLAENARAIVEQRFSWKSVGAATREFYDKL